MQLRRATMDDVYEMQNCNLRCLPENYNLRYYYYHYLTWPQLLYVQEDYNHNTVGYVLGKMDDEDNEEKKHGHITSLSVLRTHRKLGIASRVMKATMKEMDDEYQAHYCSLHVRKTNDAALHLYQDTLGYRCAGVEEGYYVDGEDAFFMKRQFRGPSKGSYIDERKHLVSRPLDDARGDAAPAHEEKKSKKDGKAAKHADPAAHEREAMLAELLEMDDKGKGKGGKGKGSKGAPATNAKSGKKK